ncbi:DedA family protein [Inquilinus limosus]|uniref:DedA family protein n=1 Tax=Inquilinus limosus TaxID=171674 RepID=UPI003F14918F
MQGFIDQTIAFIGTHAGWAGPIILAFALGESFVVLSLVLPATALLVTAGTLIQSGALSPWNVIPWAIVGAVLGDTVSYWVGAWLEHRVERIWPFTRHPQMLRSGHDFFVRWGGISVFTGRFLGPVRAVVPLVAGMMGMRHIPFQIANVASAIAWAPTWVGLGWFAGETLTRIFGIEEAAPLLIILLVVMTLAGVVAAFRLLARKSKTPHEDRPDRP